MTAPYYLTPFEVEDDRARALLQSTGLLLHNVHPSERCEGGPCVIHRPTQHHMVDWPLHWRNDTKIFERLCRHGTGHPDPDQFPFWDRSGMEWKAAHGCCEGRCCS